jgi:2-polyprenyl-6-methoxyphenol hydroxylase-like FAD-dependent oxidoreductase
MSKTATVIGAGIAGPVAALTLSHEGYDVTLHEKRELPYAGSIHMITLTAESESALTRLGVTHSELYRFEWMPMLAEQSKGRMVSNFADRGFSSAGVVWDDLHNALAKRVDITYGSKVDYIPQTDVVVWADGIGSYGRKYLSDRQGTYGGEMLFRGLTPRDVSDMAWINYSGFVTDGEWSMVSYATWDYDGTPVRGWTLFAPMAKEPWRNTQTLTNDQSARLAEMVRPIMSDKPYGLVANATEITCAPQEIWPRVNHMTYNRDGSRHFLIGDAVGTVSPKTGIGANLAIAEASNSALSRREWDIGAVNAVNEMFALSRELIERDSPFAGIHG